MLKTRTFREYKTNKAKGKRAELKNSCSNSLSSQCKTQELHRLQNLAAIDKSDKSTRLKQLNLPYCP